MLSGETLERERNCMREAKGKLLWEKLGRERERERGEALQNIYSLRQKL